MDVVSKSVIGFFGLIIFLHISSCPICDQLINTLKYINTSWNTKDSKVSPKLMMTRDKLQIFVYFISHCWITTDYSVNKWRSS